MTWLDTAFPWLGLGGALVLLVLLFATRALQADAAAPRWRDGTWLAWAGAAAYLLHNVEEYGVDLTGAAHAFPRSFCAMFGFSGAWPLCPVPPAVFTAVNVPAFWIAIPLCAWLSRRHPLAGLPIFGVMAVNGVAHLGQALAHAAYNPGCLTALVLFLPLTGWMVRARFVQRRQPLPVLAFTFGCGLAVHAILLASMLPLARGMLHTAMPTIIAQFANAALLVAAPLLAGRRLRLAA